MPPNWLGQQHEKDMRNAMDTEKDIPRRLTDFMNWCFSDGHNMPYHWKQDTPCIELFKIFKDAAAIETNSEELVDHIRNVWKKSINYRLTNDQAESIDELIETIYCWDLYERCSKKPFLP